MRAGLRFTRAQHDTVAAPAIDIVDRNGWPSGEEWWRTPRLLGHEDLKPISRHDKGGGWDPGYLRDEPYFDWSYVYQRIEDLLDGRPDHHESSEHRAIALALARRHRRQRAPEPVVPRPPPPDWWTQDRSPRGGVGARVDRCPGHHRPANVGPARVGPRTVKASLLLQLRSSLPASSSASPRTSATGAWSSGCWRAATTSPPSRSWPGAPRALDQAILETGREGSSPLQLDVCRWPVCRSAGAQAGLKGRGRSSHRPYASTRSNVPQMARPRHTSSSRGIHAPTCWTVQGWQRQSQRTTRRRTHAGDSLSGSSPARVGSTAPTRKSLARCAGQFDHGELTRLVTRWM
jgi:hypothetical protein